MEFLTLASLFLVFALVRADDTPEKTPLVGTIGQSITLNCDLEVADPINMMWKDTVYSMNRDPAVIFCTNRGAVHEEHYNHRSYEVDPENPMKLTINDLKDDDVGNYFCVSILEDGTELKKEFTLALTGDIQCEGDTEDLKEGDTATASCTVDFTSSVSPDFNWFLDGEEMDGTKDNSQFGALEIVQTWEATKEMDQKKLSCRLSFHGFERECNLALSVKHAPFVTMFEDTTGEDEMTHSFSCSVSANPAPEINVMKVNEDETSTSLDAERVEVSTKDGKATVTFKKLTMDDAGEYICEAANSIGEVSGSANLRVTEKVKEPAGSGDATILGTSLALFGLSVLMHLL